MKEGFGTMRLVIDCGAEAWKEPDMLVRTETSVVLPPFPAQGRPGRLPQTRELVVSGTPYFIPYRINDDRLQIIAVIHGARQWPESTT